MCRLDFLTLQEFLNTPIIAEKSKPTINQMNYLQPNNFKNSYKNNLFFNRKDILNMEYG